MSLAAGLPCIPTFRVPSSQVVEFYDKYFWILDFL